MISQHLRLGLGSLEKFCMKRGRNLAVQRLPIGFEQRVVCRVSNQSMPEQISTRGRRAALVDKTGSFQVSQGDTNFVVGLRRNRGE